jgi:uncharacterized membrane protein YfcA
MLTAIQIPEGWTLFPTTPFAWTLLVLAAMVVGFSKTGVAGVGILNPVLFAMLFPAGKSVGLLLPLLIMADMFAVGHYRKDAQWRYVFKSLPWVVAGILAAYFFMDKYQSLGERYDTIMKLSIGLIVLAMMGIGAWLKRRNANDDNPPTPHWYSPFFGIFTGITTMMANAAGPIYSIYLLAFGLPKKEFMGTRAVAFFIINWIKVPLQGSLGLVTAETLTINALMFPAIAVGALVGVKTLRVLPEKTFRILIQVLVGASCLKMIISAALALIQGAG